MKTEDEIKDMKAAKGHEIPCLIKGYNHGHRDGYIEALKWMLGE